MTAEFKKLLVKPWLWVAAVLISASVFALTFYWVSRTPLKKQFIVWLGLPFELTDTVKDEVSACAARYGMEECSINSYNPDDSMYAAAFAMQSSSVDIYVLTKTAAEEYSEVDIFRTLEGIDNPLTVDGKAIGALFGDYCVCIGADSKKDENLLYDALKIILAHGLKDLDSGGKSA